MKRIFLIPIVGALILATACKKDDEPVHNTPPTPQPYVEPEVDTNYVLGQYQPTRRLATMEEEGTAQNFTWGVGESPLLLYVGADNQVSSIEYDNQKRQSLVNIPASLMGGAQVMRFNYSNDQLSTIQLTETGGTTIFGASATCDGNRITSLTYNNVDESVIMGYLNNFLSSQRKDLVENISVTNLQTTYTWTGSDVSSDHITAQGSTDLAVGELVRFLNLDTSFYRMIIENSGLGEQIPGISPQLLADFVDMLADSTCHIVVDVDLTNSYTYDGHPNPLYGFWGWGFLGNTRVLSSHNILSSQREGLASVNLSVNLPTTVPDRYDWTTRMMLTLALAYLNGQYPDGFHYTYPIDLDNEATNSYSYDDQGWPTSLLDSDNHLTTFTYEL